MKKICLLFIILSCVFGCAVQDTGTKGEYEIENINGEKEILQFPMEEFCYNAKNENELSYYHGISFQEGIDIYNTGYYRFSNVLKEKKDNGDVVVSFDLVTNYELSITYFDNPDGEQFYEILDKTVPFVEKNYSFTITKDQIAELVKTENKEINIALYSGYGISGINIKAHELN